MKSKLLVVSLFVVFLFAALAVSNVALASEQCPKCHGVGTIICPTCKGIGIVPAAEAHVCPRCNGVGQVAPSVAMTIWSAEERDDGTYVWATFRNHEVVVANGTFSVQLTDVGVVLDNANGFVEIPAEDSTVGSLKMATIGGFGNPGVQSHITISPLTVANITCPQCQGTGYESESYDTCPDCAGSGEVTCPVCDGTGIVESATDVGTGNFQFPDFGIAIIGVVVVAAVAVTATVTLKRRKVSEESLRRRSNSEFQKWVLQKLSGRASSTSESSKGIDGFTGDGKPLSIKQSDDVGKNAIDSFAAALGQNKSKDGVIVAFGFGSDAIRGKVAARMNYRLEIQMLTVKELIESRSRHL